MNTNTEPVDMNEMRKKMAYALLDKSVEHHAKRQHVQAKESFLEFRRLFNQVQSDLDN
jgi:hypothetical protein